MMEHLGMSPKAKSDYSREQKMEMMELLSSATSIDTEDGVDILEENRTSHNDRNGTTGGEIYTQTKTTNSLRRPGRPVRRQRNHL